MSLPRPSEPFRRVYSPPEPPAKARRSAARAIRAALVVALLGGVAAAAAFFLLGDRPAERTARPAPPPAGGGPSSGTASPSTSRPVPRAFTKLPPVCAAPRKETADRLVPGARVVRSANDTLTSCTYSGGTEKLRWLRVEARLYPPADSATQTRSARELFAAQLAQARQGNDPTVRTVSLRTATGLGDEAYRWFKVDRGQPTVVGEVTARLRNAIITVSYSEGSVGTANPGVREERCLAEATRVATEVLAGFP